MTKSKLAITYLLTASILSPMCVNALTQQEVANIAAGSQAQATLTAEQKRAVIVQLNAEIANIKSQIALEKSKLSSDKTMRTITLTLTATGTVLIGYFLYAGATLQAPGMFSKGIFYSVLTAAGTVPFAAQAYSLSKQVNLSIEQIDDLKTKLDAAEKQFNAQLGALN